jgi:hypothetical protein
MKDESTVTEQGTTSELPKKTKVRATVAAIASLCSVGATIASVAAPRKWN